MKQVNVQNCLLEEKELTAFEEAVGFIWRDMPLTRPNGRLVGSIISAIEKKRRFYLLIKIMVFSIATVISLAGLVLVWQSEGAIIIHSEAGQLFSLLFSDWAIVSHYWREYLLSIVESLPFVSIIAVALCLWLALVSLWVVARNSKKYFINAFKHA